MIKIVKYNDKVLSYHDGWSVILSSCNNTEYISIINDDQDLFLVLIPDPHFIHNYINNYIGILEMIRSSKFKYLCSLDEDENFNVITRYSSFKRIPPGYLPNDDIFMGY